MADNVELNAGTGGATIATDDVAGIQYQVVKLALGADGAATLVANANPVPVSDAGGALTVDGTVAVSGTVAVDGSGVTQPVSGTVELGATSLAALETISAVQSGAWNITNLSGTVSLPTGASTAAKQPALGTAGAASADVITVQGVASMTPLLVTASLAAGTNNIGDIDVLTLPAIPAGNNNIGDVDVASIAAGDNNIGNVDVLTVPADPFGANADASSATGSISAKLRFMAAGIAGATSLPAGTNNIGDVDVLSIAAGDNNIGNVDIVTMPNVTLAAGTNTNEVVGDAAHDAAIAGNPLRIAGRAMTADYTSVASGDTADLLCTLNGKQVVQPYAIPENTWAYAAASGGIVNTTGVTAKAAAAAGIRNYITHVDVVNGHATVSTDVQIRDGAAGTVLWRGFAQAAGGGVSATFDPPLKGTAATLVEIACGTTGTATYFNLTGYTGP
jgi:hypothetical protein